MITALASTRVGRLFAGKGKLLNAVGWSGGYYVYEQVLRLGSNVVLAWLLSPAILGTMLLINTVRTACELLTDLGIGQSIVHNKEGEEPSFYNTAWTVQIVRGLLLFLLACAIAWPAAHIYDERLLIFIPVAASTFLLSGFISPSRYILQKRVKIQRISIFKGIAATISAIITIALAYYLRSIWALLFALPIGAVINLTFSFIILRLPELRLEFKRTHFNSIFSYGKWVFVSSMIYFAAMNFDRLYFADAVPFAVLGVYGIARTLSDSVVSLFNYLSSQVLFPTISKNASRGYDLVRKLNGPRRAVIWGIAFMLAGAMALSDVVVSLFYDERYSAAGIYLPILLAGAWFGTLAVLSESILMGIGRPRDVAVGNALKLATIIALVPAALANYGIVAAVFVFAAVEGLRWAVLTLRLRVNKIGFFREDLAATTGFVAFVLLFRSATGALGWTNGLSGWSEIVRSTFS